MEQRDRSADSSARNAAGGKSRFRVAISRRPPAGAGAGLMSRSGRETAYVADLDTRSCIWASTGRDCSAMKHEARMKMAVMQGENCFIIFSLFEFDYERRPPQAQRLREIISLKLI